MKICLFTGARPNFIKVAPLIKAIEEHRGEKADICFSLVYAGAQDDPTIEASLFDDLRICAPDVFLGVTSSNVNEITGEVMGKFEAYLSQNPADVVIVVDDLASTMAAAIVTKKKGIRLAHLVAGTRSFDINMPKEINRLVIDGLSDYLFTAGAGQGTTADQSKIYLVGNILMDTLRSNYSRFVRPAVLSELGVKDDEYAVLTVNRKAMLSNRENMKKLLSALSAAAGMPVIAPVREEARIQLAAAAEGLRNICFTDSLSYLEFGYLTAHARFVVTDSGNVAEEATFNQVPCVTLSNYTEHIETVKQGTNVLVNEDAELLTETLAGILSATEVKASIPERWDGRTAERILQILSAGC